MRRRQSRATASRSGFTIVELLIVIVVIGILASITVTAFNGVQNRARNAQTLSGVKSYQTLLLSYLAANGQYPSFSNAVCLGTGYADRTGDGVGDCGDIGGSETVAENTTFNTQLASMTSGLPKVNTFEVPTTFSGNPWAGATLTKWAAFTVDGQPAPFFIKFILEGSDLNCGSGVVSVRGGGTYPDMVSGVAKNTWWDSRSTTCILTLPNE